MGLPGQQVVIAHLIPVGMNGRLYRTLSLTSDDRAPHTLAWSVLGMGKHLLLQRNRYEHSNDNVLQATQRIQSKAYPICIKERLYVQFPMYTS